MTNGLQIWSYTTLAGDLFGSVFPGRPRNERCLTTILGAKKCHKKISETTCLPPQQRSKLSKNGTILVLTGGEYLLLSSLSYCSASTILHMAYGCHKFPGKMQRMLIFLRH